MSGRRGDGAVRWAAGVALAGGLWSGSASGATRGAEELLRQARAHEVAREDDVAARRYTEALGLDPTCVACYVGLGALRLRGGDAREAERVYDLALKHAPGALEALHGRAVARRAEGDVEGSEADLEEYVERSGTVGALRELAGWFGEDGARPRQLATWRRILARAETGADPMLAAESRTMVRALQILVGPADPVTAPAWGSATRRAIAHVAKRSGG